MRQASFAAWAGDHDRTRGRAAARWEFHLAALDQLPLADESVDVIVCALALVHIPDLQLVLAEFACVLRSGGDLVISDIHQRARLWR